MIYWLLVRLGLKCPCGGWKTLLHRTKVKIAEVRLNDGSLEDIEIALRYCLKCGLATSRSRTVKLKGVALETSE